MRDIAQAIADFLRVDIVYGYLIIGVVLGFILARVLKMLAPGRAPSGNRTVMVSEEGGAIQVAIDGRNHPIDPIAMAEVRNLADKGDKIKAIKRLRTASGLGLYESRQVVEALARLRR